jgi:hypothetical protein
VDPADLVVIFFDAMVDNQYSGVVNVSYNGNPFAIQLKECGIVKEVQDRGEGLSLKDPVRGIKPFGLAFG